jgi:RNA polymerase sigma-70 factor (ECF subfamily)
VSLAPPEGQPGASGFLPAVYAELRQVAAHYLAGQARQVTLQPTVLVHEAFLRLRAREGGFIDEEHFKAVAATAMRPVPQAGRAGGQPDPG